VGDLAAQAVVFLDAAEHPTAAVKVEHHRMGAVSLGRDVDPNGDAPVLEDDVRILDTTDGRRRTGFPSDLESELAQRSAGGVDGHRGHVGKDR
jgi:hypothetical protein